MDQQAIRAGFRWEDEVAERLGLQKVKGSGNKWYYRGDIEGQKVVLSCKNTGYGAYSVDKNEWGEIVEIAHDLGVEYVPMMCLGVGKGDDRFEVFVTGFEDMRKMFQEEMTWTRESKAEARRRIAAQPELFRDE